MSRRSGSGVLGLGVAEGKIAERILGPELAQIAVLLAKHKHKWLMLLLHIYRYGPDNPKTLGKRMKMSSRKLAKALSFLEEHGLVRLIKLDRREGAVLLTQAGYRLAKGVSALLAWYARRTGLVDVGNKYGVSVNELRHYVYKTFPELRGMNLDFCEAEKVLTEAPDFLVPLLAKPELYGARVIEIKSRGASVPLIVVPLEE